MRESAFAFMTRAGTEIGVDSTKAFTTQLVTLLMLVTALGKQQQRIGRELEAAIVDALHQLPKQIETALSFENRSKRSRKTLPISITPSSWGAVSTTRLR